MGVHRIQGRNRNGSWFACALIALVCSSCVLGGDEALGDWNVATGCSDRDAIRAAVAQIVVDSPFLQIGKLDQVSCSIELNVAAIVVARGNELLIDSLDGYTRIEFCDGDAVLGFVPAGEVGKSALPARLASQLEEDGFCRT